MRPWIPLALLALLAGCSHQPAPDPSAPGAETSPVEEPPVEAYEAHSVAVYFVDQKVTYLEAEAIDVPAAAADPTALATAAVGALLAGPTEAIHFRILPQHLALRDLTVTDGVATVDVSKDWNDFQGGSDIAALALYSLVNTLGAIDGIDAVRILVEGQPVDEFAGAFSLAEPLKPDWDLVGGKSL